MLGQRRPASRRPVQRPRRGSAGLHRRGRHPSAASIFTRSTCQDDAARLFSKARRWRRVPPSARRQPGTQLRRCSREFPRLADDACREALAGRPAAAGHRDHFAELAAARCCRGGTVIFVGGKEDTSLAEAAQADLEGPFLDLTGKTSLPELRSRAVAARDRARTMACPPHVAVALGRPVVAPFTCTKVKWTGPYGAFQQAVESRIWCQGVALGDRARRSARPNWFLNRLWPLWWQCRTTYPWCFDIRRLILFLTRQPWA